MNADIGFLGGGQLARMSIQAAQRMGLRCMSLDPGEDTPASQIAPSIRAPLDDPAALAEVFRRCYRVTLENEFVPADAVREALALAGRDERALLPGVETLATIQDKLSQREALRRAGVPSPPAAPLERDGSRAREVVGFPMMLKARFGGYDGRGTRVARTPEELESHRDAWEGGGWLAEALVPFRRELAVMAFVAASGESGAFPTVETVQTNQVCDLVFPSDADGAEIALAAVRAVGGAGLFGVELFELESGELLVNEIAPRPHNTGHYSLDWGGVSQFEQHVRLAVGLPLARVEGAPVCMANLLAREAPLDPLRGLAAALEDPDARVHWYGKREPRPGRKMGHINIVGRAPFGRGLVERATAARERFFAAAEAGS